MIQRTPKKAILSLNKNVKEKACGEIRTPAGHTSTAAVEEGRGGTVGENEASWARFWEDVGRFT